MDDFTLAVGVFMVGLFLLLGVVGVLLYIKNLRDRNKELGSTLREIQERSLLNVPPLKDYIDQRWAFILGRISHGVVPSREIYQVLPLMGVLAALSGPALEVLVLELNKSGFEAATLDFNIKYELSSTSLSMCVTWGSLKGPSFKHTATLGLPE